MARSRTNTRTPTKRSSTARPSAPPKRSASEPVTAAEFDAALEHLGIEPPFAIAVSGGADSLALMFLAAAWCKRRRIAPPLALTVDHGFRAGSAREAERVAAWARARSLPHETLVWTGAKPAANIQARAREARYRLIGEHMRASGVHVLLTGHTLDDQAETFLLRLARGSGLDGLGGMSPVAPLPLPGFADLTLARPLLCFPHARLTATLSECGQPWLDDPSNAEDRFARVRIRGAASALEAAGLTPERIAGAAAHLRRAREAIDAAAASLLDHGVEVAPWGYAVLAPDRFARAPREIALRALARLVQAIGGAPFPPRFEQTQALLAWIVAPGREPKGRTLGGCRLARRPDSAVLLTREAAALAKENPVVAVKSGAAVIWDRRIEITLLYATAPCEVRRLGPAGLKALGARGQLPVIEPRRIAVTTPGLWQADRLVAAPLLGISPPGMTILARFTGLGVSPPVKKPLRKHP